MKLTKKQLKEIIKVNIHSDNKLLERPIIGSSLTTSSHLVGKAKLEEESFGKMFVLGPFRWAGDAIYYGSFDKATQKMDARMDRQIKKSQKKTAKAFGNVTRKILTSPEAKATIKTALKTQIEVPNKLNSGGLILLKYIFEHLPDIAHTIEKKGNYKKTGFGSIGYAVKYKKGFDFTVSAIVRNETIGLDENFTLFKFSLAKFIANLDEGAEKAAIKAGVPKSLRAIIKNKIDKSKLKLFNKLWPPNLDIKPIKIFSDNSEKIETLAKNAGNWIKKKLDKNTSILAGMVVWDELLDADSAFKIQTKQS